VLSSAVGVVDRDDRSPSVSPLVLERVEVKTSAVEAVVRVTQPRFMRTADFPGIAEEALRLLPGLTRHRCVCGTSHGLDRELADTETPHMLEHVALELMALSGSSRELGGETVWDFAGDGRGVFRVRVGYDDELVALGALERGLRLVNALLVGSPVPDSEREVAELRTVREG